METVGKLKVSSYRLLLVIVLVISSLFTFGFKPAKRSDTSFYDDSDFFSSVRDRLGTAQRAQDRLESFISSIENGNSWQIVGIFVDGKFEISVVLQPSSNPGFVSGLENTATRFEMASNYGTIGMLAHNYLSGEYFFELEAGDEVNIIYGDGTYDTFKVTDIQQFQALSPYSPYSNFIDLESDTHLSAKQLFYSIYQGDGELVLQTCIDNEGIDSWGRYFVIAEPVS